MKKPETEKVIDLHPPISRKETKLLKSLREEDKEFNFTTYMYEKRERFVGEVDFKELEYFLDVVGIDLTMMSHRGLALLTLAVDFYAPAVLKYLLVKGLDANKLQPDGSTLLQFAEKKLKEALEIGWKPDSRITKCAEQSIELLKAHK